MRAIPSVLIAVSLVACATQPAGPPVARQVKVDASNVAEAQLAGYNVVDRNGTKLYCRKDAITGSRVQTQTTCLTREELLQQANRTQNAMERMQYAPQTKMGQ